MGAIHTVVLLLTFVAALAYLAQRTRLPYPILMVLGGLVLGFLPGLPRAELEPELVLLLFLPPILFAAAYENSPRDLWRNRGPIGFLAFGLVLATTLAVAGVVLWLVPGIPVPVAVALGAIVSPPDAIAATSIARRLGLPRRLVTIIEGESLINDATALVLYRFAVIAAVSGAFDLREAAVTFVVAAVGGIVIGLVVGWAVNVLFERLRDPSVEVLVSLIAPFAAYLPAESVGVSGVLAVVTAGLWHGWLAPRVISSETRTLFGSGTWSTMIFVTNGLVFLLIGLQLPEVMEGIGGRPAPELLALAVAVAATVIVVRLAWVFPASYLPRLLVPGLASRRPAPDPRGVVVLGWTGMRGAVSLAAALALPTDIPERHLIVFLTFATILATLVGQGLTLPLLIRRLGVGGDDSVIREDLEARRVATRAALRRIDALEKEVSGHDELIARLRDQYRHRAGHYERASDEAGGRDPEELDHERIRREVLDAERLAVIELYEEGKISDAALRRIERDIDLEDLRGDA